MGAALLTAQQKCKPAGQSLASGYFNSVWCLLWKEGSGEARVEARG